jgi:4-hydroxy-2-oxoheptanedioate aldolase
MRPSQVRKRWSESLPAFCTLVAFTDPDLCELVSVMGFDCIWLDLEHHGKSVETTVNQIRATRVGSADVLARPAKGEFMRMGRLLEAGAHGIMYPRCDDAAEAREVVRWMKFAPIGERGMDGGNSDNGYGCETAAKYTTAANAETFLAVQVESPSAIPHAQEIAEVEGVDMLFFGPGDYSVLSGVAGQVDHDSVRTAREAVCKAALKAGKRFGTLCFEVDDIKRVLDMGGTFIAYEADRTLLRACYTKMRTQMEELGFRFDG